jgi:hypothetical protein
MRPPPRGDRLPVLRLLCPSRLSPRASHLPAPWPAHSCPTALGLPRGGSRVPRGGFQRDAGGGGWLGVPAARCGSPGVPEERQVDRCPRLRGGVCPAQRA